jgi:hypothetical protein
MPFLAKYINKHAVKDEIKSKNRQNFCGREKDNRCGSNPLPIMNITIDTRYHRVRQT